MRLPPSDSLPGKDAPASRPARGSFDLSGTSAGLGYSTSSRSNGHFPMGRFQLPRSAEASTAWLMRLIEAMDNVASSAQACEASVVEAFSNRLDLPATPLIPDGFRFRDHPTRVSASASADVAIAYEHQATTRS
jgi:hypothetical protein